MKTSKALSLVMLALFCAPLVLAQADPEARALEEAVWAKLRQENLEEEVVEVSAEAGVVTLRGKPKNAYAKMRVIEAALGVEGVAAVESELEVAAPESAASLGQDLVRTVLNYSRYTVFDDITFQVEEGGVVTLGGYVTMPFKKKDLEERVGKVRGVTELKSEIRVLPASQSDDRLRELLFRKIYGDDLFVSYASQRNPPIHIIVDKGNVFLTGAVRSKIEKLKAESIARSTFGVLKMTSQLQVSP